LTVIRIEIANRQTALPLKPARLRRAVKMILQDAAIDRAKISLAVVDDPTMRRLNRHYLGHDWATDVLSFPLERGDAGLEAEIVVNADTARAQAPRFGWLPADELLLYVIHGTLHLVGCEDADPAQRAEMRDRERTYLSRFGLEARYDESGRKSRGTCSSRAAGSSGGGKQTP
jgi:probable rRNA maturation factor